MSPKVSMPNVMSMSHFMKRQKLKMFIYDETLMFLELIFGVCAFDRYSIVQIRFISPDSLLMSILPI